MKSVKIYIHHKYSERLFYKLFHNTTDSIHTEEGKITKINCKYNELKLILIFDESIHDNRDGYHIIDWFETYHRIQSDNHKKLHDGNQTHDYIVLSELQKILVDKRGWVVSILRTEKIYALDEESKSGLYDKSHQNLLENISENHIIVSDNFHLKNSSKKIKFHHVLTNTLFQWNEIIGIKWFQEFKEIYDNLNFNYDIGFSVRNLKDNRISIIKKLAELDNPKIFLQISNFVFHSYKNKHKYVNLHQLVNKKNVKLNSLYGKRDFDNLSIVGGGFNHGLDLDLFFRYLSKSKIQILDESWGFYKKDFSTQYLSEKTIGYMLASVPFIPTNIYPIQYIKNEFGLEYPFYQDIKNIKADTKKFVNFIKKFIENYDDNYKKLRDWSHLLYESYIYRIYNDNSLLDLIESNFRETPSHQKNKNLM